MVPYNITENDVKSVISVLRSEFLTQGPLVEKFEQSVSSYCNSKFGVAFNSATSVVSYCMYCIRIKKR